MELNIFEVATRNKIRFEFRGLISVEDLWDLKLNDLDSIFKNLNSKLKESTEESLLNVKTKKDQELEIKINIIKYIVSKKIEEMNKKTLEVENAQEKQKILQIISEKENEDLKNKSVDELKEMIKKYD